MDDEKMDDNVKEMVEEESLVQRVVTDQNYMIKTFVSIREAIYELNKNILGIDQKSGDFFENRPVCIGSLSAIEEDNKIIAKMSDSILVSLREYVKALKIES